LPPKWAGESESKAAAAGRDGCGCRVGGGGDAVATGAACVGRRAFNTGDSGGGLEGGGGGGAGDGVHAAAVAGGSLLWTPQAGGGAQPAFLPTNSGEAAATTLGSTDDPVGDALDNLRAMPADIRARAAPADMRRVKRHLQEELLLIGAGAPSGGEGTRGGGAAAARGGGAAPGGWLSARTADGSARRAKLRPPRRWACVMLGPPPLVLRLKSL